MRILTILCTAAAVLVACKPTSPDEQAASRGKAPPAVSLGVSPYADGAASSKASPEPIGRDGFRDDFERAELGPDWFADDRFFRIEGGQLVTRGAVNRGLWLRRPLPRDVRIEFTVRAEEGGADIKLEVFGDGRAAQPNSGYIVIFGGWDNTLNVIARRDEGGSDRVIGPSLPLVKGKTYRMRIERRGSVIEAYVDDLLMARMDDPKPLYGPKNRFFAFNGWLSVIRYDNLAITPL